MKKSYQTKQKINYIFGKYVISMTENYRILKCILASFLLQQ